MGHRGGNRWKQCTRPARWWQPSVRSTTSLWTSPVAREAAVRTLAQATSAVHDITVPKPCGALCHTNAVDIIGGRG